MLAVGVMLAAAWPILVVPAPLCVCDAGWGWGVGELASVWGAADASLLQ